MIVKCILNQIRINSAWRKKYFSAYNSSLKTILTINKEYLVLGIYINHKRGNHYLIMDDDNSYYLLLLPDYMFEIVDNYLSKLFYLGKINECDEDFDLISFKELIEEGGIFYDKLYELERNYTSIIDKIMKELILENEYRKIQSHN